jgi:hypothetical protein
MQGSHVKESCAVSACRQERRLWTTVALLVVWGITSLTCGDVLVAPAAASPASTATGANDGRSANLLPARKDMFEGSWNSPVGQFPSSDPAVASPWRPFDVKDIVPQFQPVREGAPRANTNTGGNDQATRNAAPVVRAPAPANPVPNGNVAPALGNFAPRQPGNAFGGVSGVPGIGGLLGNTSGQSLGNLGLGRAGSLQGILRGLGGGSAAGALGNVLGAGPFRQLGGMNNQILQGMRFIVLLQQLLSMFLPTDSALQFNESNTGESARTAFANLMGTDDGLVETADFYKGQDQVGPDVQGCGGTKSFNSNVDIDTDGRGNRVPSRTELPETSLKLGGSSVNSDQTNFIVMPNNGDCQKNLGKYASLEYRGEKVYGIVADCGPAGKTGEVSTSMAKELSDKLHASGKGNGVPKFVGNGDVDHYKGFAGDTKATYTVLPGSVDRSKPITNDQIRDNAMGLETQLASQCGKGSDSLLPM